MKRSLTTDELIAEMVEILRQGDGEFIARIANQVLSEDVSYVEDSVFHVYGENDKATCRKCGCDLTRHGYCTDLACPYSDYEQDEVPVSHEPGVAKQKKTWTVG
jgi:hypothetical protein